jgi:hypothetical protein
MWRAVAQRFVEGRMRGGRCVCKHNLSRQGRQLWGGKTRHARPNSLPWLRFGPLASLGRYQRPARRVSLCSRNLAGRPCARLRRMDTTGGYIRAGQQCSKLGLKGFGF